MLGLPRNLLHNLSRPVLQVGIRREDRKRIWERRAPLTPDAVYKLVSTGKIEVQVESCSRRVFTDTDYEKAGAFIVDGLQAPDIVLGVKEPPLHDLDGLIFRKPDHIQLMFSHTIKGQEYNMPLLSKFLNSGSSNGPYPTLIDYELLKGADGKRTVGFGWFAGAAGVLEAFSSMAQSHLEKGIASPFLYTGRPYTHRSLEDMRATLRNVGAMIKDQGLPEKLGPFIIGLTGSGNVSQGALDMLKELPLRVIPQGELEGLAKSLSYNKHMIYLLHSKPGDYLRRADGTPYDRQDYYDHPEKYSSIFYDKVAPYLTLFINGVGWTPNFPRLLARDELPYTMEKASKLQGHRFTNIADISCDVKGGLEILEKATTLSSPFYDIDNGHLPSIRMMSVDILPASMPLDASNHFSSALEPYLVDLIGQRLTGQVGEYSSALESATIAKMGHLTDKHQWLQPLAEPFIGLLNKESEQNHSMKTKRDVTFPNWASWQNRKQVLLLGSGMVAQPVVDYLVCKHGVKLMIVSNNRNELQKLAAPYDSVETAYIDMTHPARYEQHIRNADVVISLLPAQMHHEVAKVCISALKPLVTSSYVSREMGVLDSVAQEEGVLILTEMGLDPGLDHLSAVSSINKLIDQKKKIVSFVSMCGGLPAPDCAYDVPLKYKFSWRPQGVLSAALQDAFYVLFGKIQKVLGDQLLQNCWEKLPISPELDLEGLPNRNVLTYLKLYRLRTLRTFVRGTLRYRGYSSLLNSFKKLGLLNNKQEVQFDGWNSFVRISILAEYKSADGYIPPLYEIIPSADLQSLSDALAWLGLSVPGLELPPQPMPPLPRRPQTPLNTFAYLLSEKLCYGPGDKDMVVLSHETITEDVRKAGCRQEEIHTSKLVTYGTDVMNASFIGERPASAMARTVGLPAAIAAMLIVEGKITLTGVRRPVYKEIYKPVLEELAQMGIVMEENTRKVERKQGHPLDGPLTVEDAIVMSAKPETKQKLLAGQMEESQKFDLDSFQGWKEEEFVEWPEDFKNLNSKK